MKIAIYHDLPSGGAKRTLYETMKRLAPHHTLDVYTLDTADRDFCSLSEFSNQEFVFHFSPAKLFQSPFGRLNQLQRWQDLQRLDRLARRIAKAIDKEQYDVVFAQPCMWTQAPLVLRYLHTPTIYYCHEHPRHLYEAFNAVEARFNWRHIIDNVDPFLPLYRSTAKRFDREAARSAKLILVNSIFIREQVRRIYGIDPIISYHGVDTSTFHPSSGRGKGSYVLSVGAIQPHKGFDFLIDSLSSIDKRFRPALHLVGNMKNSSELDALYSRAKEKDVDLHVEVGIDQNALVQKYRDAMLVAYAPYNEPFGLVPLEAMACGKSVVGVCEGGIKETVIDQYTGFLVDRDPRKFAEAVQKLIGNPPLADQFGRNGRQHVLENWSWEKSVSNLQKQFQSLIK